MKLKTYQAPTLHAALRLARIELGSEAVLLEAKERDEQTAEARFQVTFALGAEAVDFADQQPARLAMPHWKTYLPQTGEAAGPEQAPAPTQPADAQPTAAAVPAADEAKPARAKPKRRVARKKAAPKRQAPARVSSRKTPPPHPAPPPVLPDSLSALRTPELAALFGRLVAAGVAAGEANSLCSRAAQAAGRQDDAAALEASLREILDAGWRIHSVPEPAPEAARILALAGPAGAGKSSTAVKAASLLIRAYDRPAALVSLGRHPVGGVEALEAWATLLQLPLEIVESPAELAPALDRLTGGPNPPAAVLLDLPPGYADPLPGVETHLVLPAAYSAADLAQTIERYSPLDPAATVFTRLDEAAAPGVLWSLHRTGTLPASFLGCGPSTPGDLRPATPARLTQRLLGR